MAEFETGLLRKLSQIQTRFGSTAGNRKTP
jgi:hypothetical protein